MRTPRVSACLRSNQPFLPVTIAAMSCTLSLWLTLRFCRQLWPGEGGVVLVPLGVTWEAAKVLFGPVGLRWACSGQAKRRVAGLALTAVALVLAAGSVAASMACFTWVQDHNRARFVAESSEYVAAMTDANSWSEQIAITLANARDLTKHHRDTKSMAALTDLESMRERRAEALARAAKVADAHSEEAFSSGVGAVLPGMQAGTLQWAGHMTVAVMLELITVAAACLARVRLENLKGTGRSSTNAMRFRPQGRREARQALKWIARIKEDIEERGMHGVSSGQEHPRSLRLPMSANEVNRDVAPSAVAGAVAPGAVAGAVGPGAVAGAVGPGAVAGADGPGAVAGAVAGAVSPSAVVPGAVTGAVAPSAVALGAFPPAVAEARALILKHRMAPTSRAIKRAFNVGQKVALGILTDMRAEGLLARNGRSYELVG